MLQKVSKHIFILQKDLYFFEYITSWFNIKISAPALKIVKNGKCATTETESGPTTTTASPLDMVHQTATELSNTAHETVEEHAPMLSSMTTPSTSMVDDAHSMAHIRSKSKH